MNIEPKEVQPGFFKRNYKEAFKMFLRSSWVWFLIYGVIVILFKGIIFTPTTGILCSVLLGVFLMIVSLEISEKSYNGFSFWNNFEKFTKSVLNGLSFLFKNRAWVLLGMFSVFLFIVGTEDYWQSFLSKEELVELMKKKAERPKDILYNFNWSFFYGALIINGAMRLGFLGYFIMKQFDISDKRILYSICDKASRINVKYTILNDMLLLIPFVLSSFLGFAFIMYPLYGIFSYLLYREILGLEKKKEVKKGVVAPLNNLKIG